jgi:thiopurine S-methyltransferase
LRAHHERFLTRGADEERIFVPLCGKTLDMLYLSGFGQVAGVEVSQLAIDEFREENKLSQDDVLASESGNKVFRFSPVNSDAKTVTIGKFDIFNLPPNWHKTPQAGQFTAAYDRASFIAIDPPLRPAYATMMKEQLADKAKVMLITLEYDTSKGSGPPFSTSEADVRAAFEPAGFQVNLIEIRDLIDAPDQSNWKSKGHTYLNEILFLLAKI